MRCYITSRFKDAIQNKSDIIALCDAVSAAGFESVSFIRDVEKFNPHHFSSQTEVYSSALELLRSCDCLLIDVSDAPSSGRNVEAGMAYALGLPIYVIATSDTIYKQFYDGIATSVIRYTSYADITRELQAHSSKNRE